jgi:hypothetical protein
LSGEDIGGGMQITLCVAADELTVTGEGHVALEDTGAHTTGCLIGFFGMLGELQCRPTVSDREILMLIPLGVGGALRKLLFELPVAHLVDEVERPRAELHTLAAALSFLLTVIVASGVRDRGEGGERSKNSCDGQCFCALAHGGLLFFLTKSRK